MIFLFSILIIIIPHIQASLTYNNVSVTTLSQSRLTLFQNPKIGDQFGGSVSSAGDFNDDGYNDLIIGAKMANSSAGIVYVIFGGKNGPTDLTISSSLAPNQSLIIYPATPGGQLGNVVCNAEDVNGDGVDDILISANTYQASTGIVYVIYGGKNLPSQKESIDIFFPQGTNITQGFAVIGAGTSHWLGVGLSAAGDVNKDRIDDFIIGAHGVSNKKGAAYIIFGVNGTRPNITLATGLGPTEGLAVLGANDDDYVGYSVSKGGDLNGDGVDDVIIGAVGIESWTGGMFVIFGKQSSTFATIDFSQGLSPTQGFAVIGKGTSSYFGISVANVKDFNGDGNNDILVGAYIEDFYKGAAYVFFGGTGLTNISLSSGLDPARGIRFQGANNYDLVGFSLSNAGDYNGDGLNDIIVGGYQANGNNGVAYVIFGRKNPAANTNLADTLTPDQGFAINGAYTYDFLGCAVSNAGDMNQDGMDDLIIGAYHANTQPGAAYLLFTPLVCPSTCLTCTKTWICQTCQTGYGLYDSMCISCPSSTKLVDGVCQPKSVSSTTKVAQGLFNSGSTASRIFTMGRSLSVGLGLIAKIIQNVRYLNISYPEEAMTAFESYGTDLFELPIPELFYETPETKPLPTQYSRYDISPTFLENYWQTIMMMLISLACMLVIKFFQLMTKNQRKEHIIQVALKNISQTAANFLIIQMYSSLDDVIFYFLLDTSSTKVSSPSAGISLGLGSCFLILGLALIFFHCWLLSKYQQAKRQDTLERFKNKFRVLGTLFEDFKDDSTSKQMIFGILLLRCVFLVLVIMLLQPPWIQTSLLMLTNLIFLGYLIHQRPFKSRFDEFTQYFSELTVFSAYLSVLILSILDFQEEDEASSFRKSLGKCIVLAGIVLCLGGFIIQVIQISGAIYEIYKFCKDYFGAKKNQTSTLKIKPRRNEGSLMIMQANPQIKSLENKSELEISYATSEGPLIHHQRGILKFESHVNNQEGLESSPQIEFSRKRKKFKKRQKISETNKQ